MIDLIKRKGKWTVGVMPLEPGKKPMHAVGNGED